MANWPICTQNVPVGPLGDGSTPFFFLVASLGGEKEKKESGVEPPHSKGFL